MTNVLPRPKPVVVVAALTEGCSLRSTARMTGVDRETVGTIVARVGAGCLALLDETGKTLWSTDDLVAATLDGVRP